MRIRRLAATLTVLSMVVVLVVACVVWALPRHRAGQPTPADPPEQVVRTAVDSLNARGFDTWNVLTPDG